MDDHERVVAVAYGSDPAPVRRPLARRDSSARHRMLTASVRADNDEAAASVREGDRVSARRPDGIGQLEFVAGDGGQSPCEGAIKGLRDDCGRMQDAVLVAPL